MATMTKTRTPKQLTTRIEKLKGKEAKLIFAAGLVRNERKGLELELKEARAAAKGKTA